MLHVFCPTADMHNTVNDNETDSLFILKEQETLIICITQTHLCVTALKAYKPISISWRHVFKSGKSKHIL